MWEDKVNQSGAVDLTPKTMPLPTIRQPNRPNVNAARPGVCFYNGFMKIFMNF